MSPRKRPGRWTSISLRQTLILGSVLCILLPALLLGFFQIITTFNERIYLEARLPLQLYADLLSNGVVAAVWNIDQEAAGEQVNAIMLIPDIVSVTLTDQDRKIFASGNNSTLSIKRLLREDREVLHKGEWIGHITMVLSMDRIYSDVQRALTKLGATFLAQIVISIVFIWIFFERCIGRPLKSIQQEVIRIAHGDFNRPLHWGRQDEMGNLILGLNKMRKELAILTRDREKHIVDLEITRELLEKESAHKEEREKLLSTILEALPVAVFAKDIQKGFQITIWNKKAEELTNLKAQDYIGKYDSDFFPKEQADYFRAQDIEASKSHSVIEIPEEVVQIPKGVMLFHTKKIVIRDPNGDPKFLLGITEDITQSKQVAVALLAAKESAENNARIKSRFLDIAAHELRTPLTAASLLLQLTQMKLTQGCPVQVATLMRLSAQLSQLSHLVVDLLDVSRLERGVLPLTRKPTDLIALVSECLDNFSLQAPNQPIEFKKPEYKIELNIDPVRICQVVSNLIDNSIKYSPENMPIEVVIKKTKTIKSQKPLESVRISVIDRGPGISEKHQATLFKPFARGAADSVTGSSGLGLGLFICNEIITLHGGTIGVKSKLGAGATFFFELPQISVA